MSPADVKACRAITNKILRVVWKGRRNRQGIFFAAAVTDLFVVNFIFRVSIAIDPSPH